MQRRALFALPGLFLAFGAAGAGAGADPKETAALHALFDRQWEAGARRYPEWATMRGDLRYNDQVTDHSLAAEAAWDGQVRAWLDEARKVRREALSPEDRLSLDLFIYSLERDVAEQAFAVGAIEEHREAVVGRQAQALE